MKLLGFVLMIPFVFEILLIIAFLLATLHIKKRGIRPEDLEHNGMYDKGFSFGQHIRSLTFLFIILFIIGFLLYRGWIF